MKTTPMKITPMKITPIPGPYRPDPIIASPAGSSLAEKIGIGVAAANFPECKLRFRNDRWAATVGLESLGDAEWIAHFGRFEPLPGNLPEPLALKYHGHQFRVYNPEIGDGRGFLFAQMRDHLDRCIDLGTKGSGTTPYSRRGDGRLTLKGAVREILATEMLEALGVNTSKTFSVVETAEQLMRGDEPSPTRSAVLVRLSHSHIRIGTFQRLAAIDDAETMIQLVNYCLTHLYNVMPGDDPAAQLLALCVERIADLAASYMVAGFVHGVLNSDNINITGESFDYGPWRFTPNWDPRFTAAYFDENGLYAFGRQAEAVHWNLGQLAVSLRLLTDAPPLIAALERFGDRFQENLIRRFLWRLGLNSKSVGEDRDLIAAAERAMIHAQIPIDSFFHNFRSGTLAETQARTLAGNSSDLSSFLALSDHYQPTQSSTTEYWNSNAICSMHIDEVEAIWEVIADRDDWQPLFKKISEIRQLGEALTCPIIH
jgi:serine/tyrosine/threonine adenylyltransferase